MLSGTSCAAVKAGVAGAGTRRGAEIDARIELRAFEAVSIPDDIAEQQFGQQ